MQFLRPGLLLMMLAFGPGTGNSNELICAPVVAESPARCTFDIWGYVLDANGQPVAGVQVTDGSAVAISSADGFYDLYALPGSHNVSAPHPTIDDCNVTVHVDDSAITSLVEGGMRQDLHLPCA